MATYSSLRWLISITERPLPCQSSISAWARCSTAVGSAAGPAQKLWARLLTSTLSLFAVTGLRAVFGLGHRFFVLLDEFAFQHFQLVFVAAGRLLHALQADQGLVLGAAHPQGPLALADLIGLDTTMAVAQSLYEEFKEPLYAPPPLLARMVDAGLLGRKVGRGFYTYDR